ncbi:MAG: triphosphoribosyl-dephospho-CoA synthase [Rubrobacteraceae bacterium]
MDPGKGPSPVPRSVVAASAAVALTLAYSAPTPGAGSRYADSPLAPAVAHESRMLFASAAGGILSTADERGVGETVLEAALSALDLSGFADPRAVGYLSLLARSNLLGTSTGTVLAGLGREEIEPFVRAFQTTGGSLLDALGVALSAGKDATLRDAMRFASRRDPLARDYARDFEVPRELAKPAILASLSRAESARASLVQAYLEVLSEVPDLDIAARAGTREAEDVSRMAKGVLKAGGTFSRRGLQGIANLDGILREDPRLSPTATEPVIVAAAFMVCIEYGPDALSRRLRPASPGSKGR